MHKRNDANGHKNADGAVANWSANHGWEGDAGVPPHVARVRELQAKNFIALLLLVVQAEARWHMAVDTSLSAPDDSELDQRRVLSQPSHVVAGRIVVVLIEDR